MGLIYVNPEGPGGHPDPRGCRRAYPNHLQPHGHER
jgi:catalase (peroxidase I)